MKSIYAHLSPDKFTFSKELKFSHFTCSGIPEYAKYSFEQTEHFLKEQPIVLTNSDIDSEYTSEINEFFLLCKKGFPSFSDDPFWLTTLLRLYVVYLYVQKHNIQEFIHLEYDNLIFSDLKELKQLPKSVYFTRVGPFQSSAGFVFCNSIEHFEKFINKLKQLLEKGESFVQRFTQYDQLSEMILIDLIHTHTKDVMDYLPILPDGVGCDNFDKLRVLFDGASYGQYLGGTNKQDNKGWFGMHHYIGREINNKTIQVVFEDKPYVITHNKKIPLTNLHVHSKKLEQYIIKK